MRNITILYTKAGITDTQVVEKVASYYIESVENIKALTGSPSALIYFPDFDQDNATEIYGIMVKYDFTVWEHNAQKILYGNIDEPGLHEFAIVSKAWDAQFVKVLIILPDEIERKIPDYLYNAIQKSIHNPISLDVTKESCVYEKNPMIPCRIYERPKAHYDYIIQPVVGMLSNSFYTLWTITNFQDKQPSIEFMSF